MKWLFLVTLLLGTQAMSSPSVLLQTHQVWVVQKIRWEKAPADVNPKLSSGGGTVLYFGPNRKFGMIECVLNKEGGSLTISHGDGQNIYIGEWAEQNGAAIVSYRLVSRTVEKIGEKLPGQLQTARISLDLAKKTRSKGHLASRIIFNGSAFEPTSKLDLKDVISYFPKKTPS